VTNPRNERERNERKKESERMMMIHKVSSFVGWNPRAVLILLSTFAAWVQPEQPGEILGPTFIVHPADPPLCIAYESTRERISLPVVPLPPSSSSSSSLPGAVPLTSLVPTEVAHVWVVTRVAGSATVNLRSPSGKFLSCDTHGVVTADREARGPQEEWTPEVLPDISPPMVAFKNLYDKYLGVDEVAGGSLTLRGDAEEVGFNERFFVRVQNSYKKKAHEEERDKNFAAKEDVYGRINEAEVK
jgi:protein FRG1